MSAWSRGMPWLFEVLEGRDQNIYGNIEMLLKDMKAEPKAEEPLPIKIMQHLGKDKWPPLQVQYFPPANNTKVWNAHVVGFDAQKIRTLVKVAKSLNFNTAKEVRVVVELACDMHNMHADEIKEYRELLYSLGKKDPEDPRALRQLPKENKTIDATGRESSERSRITQEAQNVEEEDEDQEFVDPSDSSRHASA
ncbi:hypothetical protein N0V92_004067 [Colletotrichum tropicale]|nr:hypothetical protein N0V92_004067 [Colletotrichum tropicale]